MDKDYRSNFAMMIPQRPLRKPKQKAVSWKKKMLCRLIGHRWKIWMISKTGPGGMPHKCKRCGKITSKEWPFKLREFGWIILDCVLYPTCYFGGHRWKATYRFSSFSYGGSSPSAVHEEENFVCMKCGKKKTVKIK